MASNRRSLTVRDHGHVEGERVYKVAQAVNTVEFPIGTVLPESEVQEIIMRRGPGEITVTIKPRQ